MRIRQALCLLVFGLCPFLQAQPVINHSNFESVLVPVVITYRPLTSAGGGRWLAPLYVHNAGAEPVWVIFMEAACAGIPEGCPPELDGFFLQPGVTAFYYGLPNEQHEANLGIVLQVERSKAQDVFISSRLYNEAVEVEGEGVDLPVVREFAFIRGRTVLVDVPVGGNVRQTLRIYDPEGHLLQPAEFRIRVFPRSGGPALVDTALEALVNRHEFDYAVFPQYAEITNLAASFPEVAAAGRVNVQIDSLIPDRRFYAFVSITDNETERVSVILPH